MLTDKDVEKLKETFATKKEIDQKFKNIDQKFKNIDQKFIETNRHFDIVAEDLKNSITLLAEHVSGRNKGTDEHEKSHEILASDVSILKTKMIADEAKINK
ncbi:hypothetical protein KKB43_04750 [Patescibacteria group bacterium]|nr:hypothetical protein [Patescibacteria group bacterium]